AYFLFAMSELTHHPLAPHIPRGLRQRMAQVVRSSKEGLLVWRAASLLALTEASGDSEAWLPNIGYDSTTSSHRHMSLAGLFSAAAKAVTAMQQGSGDADDADVEADVDADVKADVDADVGEKKSEEDVKVEGSAGEAMQVEDEQKEEEAARNNQHVSEGRSKGAEQEKGGGEGEEEEGVEELRVSKGAGRGRGKKRRGRGGRAGAAGRRVRGKQAVEAEKGEGQGKASGGADDEGVREVEMVGGERVMMKCWRLVGSEEVEGDKEVMECEEVKGSEGGKESEEGVEEVKDLTVEDSTGKQYAAERSGEVQLVKVGTGVGSSALPVTTRVLRSQSNREALSAVERGAGESHRGAIVGGTETDGKGDGGVGKKAGGVEDAEQEESAADDAMCQSLASCRLLLLIIDALLRDFHHRRHTLLTTPSLSKYRRLETIKSTLLFRFLQGQGTLGLEQLWESLVALVFACAGEEEEEDEDEGEGEEEGKSGSEDIRQEIKGEAEDKGGGNDGGEEKDKGEEGEELGRKRKRARTEGEGEEDEKQEVKGKEGVKDESDGEARREKQSQWGREEGKEGEEAKERKEEREGKEETRAAAEAAEEEKEAKRQSVRRARACAAPNRLELARAAQLLLGAVLDLHGIIADNDGYRRARNEKEAMEDRVVRLFALEPSVAKKSFFLQTMVDPCHKYHLIVLLFSRFGPVLSKGSQIKRDLLAVLLCHACQAYFDINPNAILELLQAQKPSAGSKRPSRKKAAPAAAEAAPEEAAAAAAPTTICDMIVDAVRACPFTGELSNLGRSCLIALEAFTKILQ
ncbi:unnamed protein product, partial [Closterium sp. Yama58-4]